MEIGRPRRTVRGLRVRKTGENTFKQAPNGLKTSKVGRKTLKKWPETRDFAGKQEKAGKHEGRRLDPVFLRVSSLPAKKFSVPRLEAIVRVDPGWNGPDFGFGEALVG